MKDGMDLPQESAVETSECSGQATPALEIVLCSLKVTQRLFVHRFIDTPGCL